VFFGLAKIWACTGLGKYTVHCLSLQKIWSSSTVVSETHAAQQMAHIQLRTSICWQPSALRLWTTTIWSCSERFTTQCTIFKLQCNVVCTSYSHGLLFYTSVCQSVYRVKRAIATALLQMDFSSTCLIIVFTPHKNMLGLKGKQQQDPITLLNHALSSQGSSRTS
jgi:hypothetical protein